MVFEHEREYSSQWGAMTSMAKQLFFCNLTESDLRSDSPVV